MTDGRVERRLAAVLAADIAGYSRLMGADEEGTLARLKAVRKAFVDPIIAAYRGRIVKTTGDGMLVEFASAVDAVRCSVDVQREMAAQNASVPQNQRIEFRIGIHVGDIIFDDNDIFGDGVNVAARVEGECAPGGVYLSDDAFRQVRSTTSFVFDDLGEKALKNIERPVRIFAIRIDTSTPAPSPQAGGEQSTVSANVSVPDANKPSALPSKPSIVVLPLQNMSGDVEQEYFADGLTENLTTDLSRFGSLFVVGRNTAFTYKGKAIDLKQVGRELGVRYALEGSVQRGGDRIRVNVQLIDTQTGGHLWAERFDRDRTDLFKVQDEISRGVAYSLTLQVSKSEVERAQREPSGNPESMILAFHGRSSTGSTADGVRARLKLFEQTAQLDSSNVDAWAGIAAARSSLLFLGWSEDRAEDLRSAIAASQQALTINPTNHYAIYAKGHIALVTRDYPAALEAYEQAIQLNPSWPLYYHLAGMANVALGRAERALELFDEAIRFSPRDLWIADVYAVKGWAYWELERYPEALQWLERAKVQNSRLSFAKAFLVSTHLRMGQQQKAEATVRDTLQYQPNWTAKVVEESYPLRPASLAALVEDLRKAGLPDR